MKLHFLRFIFLCVSLGFNSHLSAQVTIGGGGQPNKGALLDLKQHDAVTAGGVTATKGLGLPRVKLIKQKGDLASTIDGAFMFSYTDDHTGLVIYNINECIGGSGRDNGVYVWTGSEWIPLQNKDEEELAPGVIQVTDNRDQELGPQTYLAREFSYTENNVKVDVGIWMLENLRYIPLSTDNSFIHSPDEAEIEKHWCYPLAGGGLYNPSKAKQEWLPNLGILYNWAAAMNGYEPSCSDQGEYDQNDGADGVQQGICPDGWHVPSDHEWNDLEQAIYHNPTEYSTYTTGYTFNPASWKDEWNGSLDLPSPAQGPRGSDSGEGHGYAMLAKCRVSSLPNFITTKGKSLSPRKGGFSFEFAGRGRNGAVESLGDVGDVWSGSIHSLNRAGENSNAWCRSIYTGYPTNNAKVVRHNYGVYHLFSVRCKKD